MNAKRRTIGFDRKLQPGWLDAAADCAAQGLSVGAARERLRSLLVGQVADGGERSALQKTVTVLLHIWVAIPENLIPLRNDGLGLLRDRMGRDCLPVHWGMCVATYPYFHDVAAAAGRLLSIQDTVALSQVIRRIAETWGERNTIRRTVRHAIRTMVDWGTLVETGERGVYSQAGKTPVSNDDGIVSWLCEVELWNRDGLSGPLRNIVKAPSLFPFNLSIKTRDISTNPRLELHRQGLDEDIVVLNARS